MKISTFLSYAKRTAWCFTSPFNAISLVIVIAYWMMRTSSGVEVQRNVVGMTACIAFTRWLRASTSVAAASAVTTILQASVLVEAFFSYPSSRTFSIMLSVFVCLWLCVEKDTRHYGPPSKIKQIESVAEWERAKDAKSLVFFCDPSLSACAEYANVHAELSVSTSECDFHIVDLTRNKDLVEKAKVYLLNQPVLVKYENGEEVLRFPASSGKQHSEKQINRHVEMDRNYRYNNIKSRFSL